MMLLYMADVLNNCVNCDFTEHNSDYNEFTYSYVCRAFVNAQEKLPPSYPATVLVVSDKLLNG